MYVLTATATNSPALNLTFPATQPSHYGDLASSVQKPTHTWQGLANAELLCFFSVTVVNVGARPKNGSKTVSERSLWEVHI